MAADFVWNRAAAERVRQETEAAMREQAENMRDTVRAWRATIPEVDGMARDREHVAVSAMKDETRYRTEGGTQVPYTVSVPDLPRRAQARGEAADYREQSRLLSAGALRLGRAVDDLESDIRRTNALFYRMHEEALAADAAGAAQLRGIRDEIRGYIRAMQELRDSFDDHICVREPALHMLGEVAHSEALDAPDAARTP